MNLAEELETMMLFVRRGSWGDTIPEMEHNRDLAIGYEQRAGELLNRAVRDLALSYEEKLQSLRSMEEETETTRKAKLEAWTADSKMVVNNLKSLKGGLKAVRMALMQSIKTRREER